MIQPSVCGVAIAVIVAAADSFHGCFEMTRARGIGESETRDTFSPFLPSAMEISDARTFAFVAPHAHFVSQPTLSDDGVV